MSAGRVPPARRRGEAKGLRAPRADARASQTIFGLKARDKRLGKIAPDAGLPGVMAAAPVRLRLDRRAHAIAYRQSAQSALDFLGESARVHLSPMQYKYADDWMYSRRPCGTGPLISAKKLAAPL